MFTTLKSGDGGSGSGSVLGTPRVVALFRRFAARWLTSWRLRFFNRLLALPSYPG
jgi:hypothetical protein